MYEDNVVYRGLMKDALSLNGKLHLNYASGDFLGYF